jgi:serine/threonine protein kinase
VRFPAILHRRVIGQTLGGKYAIVRLLGEGGMGAVYEARHTGTGRRVAIKVITGELDPLLVTRFELEARAAGAVESEHIVQILDVGRDEASGAPFLAMEYLVGEDVQQLLRRLGAIPADLALRIGVQACLGLEKAHAQGVIHRDIKPANLFLAEREGGALVLKVLDFGIAKVTAGELGAGPRQMPLTRSGVVMGSPLYMSPEQARNKGELDHRTDIWSLGIVLHQALTGRSPFDHVASVGDFIVAVCTVPVAPIHPIAPWVDLRIAEAVERALRIAPADRYASVTEMREALQSFLPGGSAIQASMVVSAREDAGPEALGLIAQATLPATPFAVATDPPAHKPSAATGASAPPPPSPRSPSHRARAPERRA